jgi:PhnB protein
MLITPYVHFNGRCDEAIEFYGKALGAKVQFLMRFKECPQPVTPGTEEKVMHANLQIGGSTVLMSDGRCDGTTDFKGFALSLTVDSVQEAETFFAALSDGGQVQMPLTATFFSPSFGMVADRFGVCWMVYVQGS